MRAFRGHKRMTYELRPTGRRDAPVTMRNRADQGIATLFERT
jgi:hypothetical protein